MGYPTFDSLSLQDDTYVTSEINYRSTPVRSLDMEKLVRQAGVKLLGHDYAERRVTMKGYIIGTSPSDLQDKIDELHRQVTRKEEGTLYVDTDRSGTASVVSVGIADPAYAQDFVPFEIEFLMADPFWYGSQRLATVDVPVGSGTIYVSTSISGSAYAEPTLTYDAPAGGGYTTTSGIIVTYDPTGEQITWSGTGGTPSLAYGSDVQFDYAHQRILEDSDEVDIKGVFSRWEPGDTSFTVTFSGTAAGGTVSLSYLPRFF